LLRNSNISLDHRNRQGSQTLQGWRFLSVLASILAGLVVFTGTAYAIDPDRAMSQYVHERWGNERGFPPGPVYAIAQSSDGYLWIGTQAGLVRFDGLTFSLVRDAPALLDNGSVLGLTPDRDGNLWVRMEGSTLLRYRDGLFNMPPNLPTPEFLITATNQTNQGDLLLSNTDRGAKVFRGNRFEIVADGSTLTQRPVLSVAQTSEGSIWLGTTAGLFRLNKGQTSSVAEGPPDLKVNCLLADGNGSLWIGTDNGIFRWDGNRITPVGMPASFNHLQVLAILKDRDANIWIGTDSGGLLRLNERGVSSLDKGEGRSHEAVTALFEDREGNLWIGSDSGIQRLRDSAFVTYSLPEGLPSDGSNPVFVDSENRMWFPPVQGGLWWLKDGQHGRITSAGLDQDVVYSIDGRNGEIWVGRQHGGLTRVSFERGSFTAKPYTHADGLAQDSIYSVYLANDGTVWAGTLSAGVSALHNEKFTNYTIANGLASDTVASILETSDATMWFATPKGLSALSKGRWQTYRSGDGLPSENVNCLFQDSSGVLWAGTASGLAFHGDRGFQVPQALPPYLRAQILGLAEDKYGSLWIATSNNVLRVNRVSLLRGSLAEDDVREYRFADGLRGVQGVKRHRSVVADPTGRIWFSLDRGISVVDPARLSGNSVPPIPHVQAIFADGSPLGDRGTIHVPGDRRRVTFTYTGLGLGAPEQILFRYFLEGFDHGWSDPAATRQAVYTNLSPRHYRFRVIARNLNGIWSSQESAIDLQVDPLFWQTWWFRAGCLAVCIAATLGIYRFRLRELTRQLNLRSEERLAERTRIARELHDTLLQSFHGLLFRFQAARNLLPRRPEEAIQALDGAITRAEQAIDEGRDAIQDIRSEQVVKSDLAQLLTETGQELAAAQDTNPDANTHPAAFRVTVEGERQDLAPMLQDEIYRIAREVLRNAFQHASAHRIEAEIRYDDRLFRLRIRDDGRGIDQKVLDEGGRAGHWGLPGIQERAKRIGARLDFWSQAGAGTEVELTVPASVAFSSQNRRGFALFRRRARADEHLS
jgi:ligand-binding sensor domain-containing protein/signal transduction histidine kinase